MSRKVLIPRKDHEVYIPPLPDGLSTRKRELRRFAREKLPELHPGFSPFTEYDVRLLTANKKRYALITVMERDALVEYRLEHPKSFFFTATALLLRVSGSGPGDYEGERIGFRPEDGEPVSEPLGESGAASGAPSAFPAALLKTARPVDAVFRKKAPALVFLLPLLPLLFAVIFFTSRLPVGSEAAAEPDETAPPAPARPGAVAILAGTAEALVASGGVLSQWKYDEAANPAIFISTEGAAPEKLLDFFKALTYMRIETLSDIQYQGSSPSYTLAAALDLSGYAEAAYRNPESSEALLAVASLVRAELTKAGANITSESLPNHGAGETRGTLSLNCGAGDFAPVLAALEEAVFEIPLHIPYMDLVFEKSRAVFTLSFSFVPLQSGSTRVSGGIDTAALPAAFGYTPPEAAPARRGVPAGQSSPSPGADYTKIGLIKQDDGETYTYYRTPEGKTLILGESK